MTTYVNDINLADLLSNRPAASIAGRTFYATDTGDRYRDNGSAWILQASKSARKVHNLVVDFGADNTGVSDMGAALTSAIAAAADGEAIYAPAGTYLCSSGSTGGTIFSMAGAGIELFGEGMGNTIFQLANTLTLASDLTLFRLTGTGQEIHDLTISCGSGYSGTHNVIGVSVDAGAFYPKISRTEYIALYGGAGAGGCGISMFQPWNQPEITTTLGTAVGGAGAATVTPGSMNGIYVGRRLLVGSSGADSTTGVAVTAVTQTTFTATFATSHLAADTVTGSSSGNQYGHYEQNIVRNAHASCGMICNASANTIRANRIFAVGGNALQHGIYLQGGNNIVEANHIEGCAGYGIHMHKAVPFIDGSGDRVAHNTLLDLGFGYIIADSIPSDGTNPEVPGAQAVPTTPTLTVNTAGTTQYDYELTFTFPFGTNAVGQGETTPSAVATTTLAAATPNNTLSALPALPTGAIFLNIYRRTAGSGSYFLIRSQANSTNFTDNNTANGTATAPTLDTTAPTLNRSVVIAHNTCKARKNSVPTSAGIAVSVPAVIEGNIIEDVPNGVFGQASNGSHDVIVRGNTFRTLNQTPSGTGVNPNGGTNWLIEGNQFLNWQNGSCVSASVGARILGNTFSLWASSLTKAVGLLTDTEVAGNRFLISGAGGAALNPGANMTGVLVHDNTFAMLSAGTVGQFNNTHGMAFYNNTITGGGLLRYDSGSQAMQFYNNEGLISFGGQSGLVAKRTAGPLLYFPKDTSAFASTGGQLLKIASGKLSLLATTDPSFVAVSLSGSSSLATDYYAHGRAGTEALILADGAWTQGNIGIPSATSAARIHDTASSTPPGSGSYVLFLDTGSGTADTTNGNGAGIARCLVLKTL